MKRGMGSAKLGLGRDGPVDVGYSASTLGDRDDVVKTKRGELPWNGDTRGLVGDAGEVSER